MHTIANRLAAVATVLAAGAAIAGLAIRGLYVDAPNWVQQAQGTDLATLFLAEIYGMTGDEAVKEKLQKAVKLIQKTQNREGGWRYQPVPYDADISVTWDLTSLRGEQVRLQLQLAQRIAQVGRDREGTPLREHEDAGRTRQQRRARGDLREPLVDLGQRARGLGHRSRVRRDFGQCAQRAEHLGKPEKPVQG